tara:strand:- start:3339 stop:3887 length:549 start_codon:yes stop_codon:yes gene_type:complete
MKNKILAAIILLTPIAVVVVSSIIFSAGISPTNTNNNGVFFKDYFNFEQFSIKEDKEEFKFTDGKWVLSVYVTDIEKAQESIYFMRQLNVALNRDIYKLKRVAFFSNKLIEQDLDELLKDYPRTSKLIDENGMLLNVLQRNSSIDMNIENPIFIIDPYGRAVMFFPPGTDPKKILKDLKVLI